MSDDLKDYFERNCDPSYHCVDSDLLDGFSSEDDSYDDFLLSVANLYGGY